MFTGIVQGVAQLISVLDDDSIRTLEIEFPMGFLDGLEVGGSISVDGVCLTATSVSPPDRVIFDVILQSISVSTLGGFEPGAEVNVERAAKDGAEIGGHPLSGHVDLSGTIQKVTELGGNKVLRISIPPPFDRYIFSKGCIAVNGCSLTVSECDKGKGWFEIWLIPETRRVTNLDTKAVGDCLNVEIERGTQVLVETVRDTIIEALGDLQPVLEDLMKERGLLLEDILTRPLMLPRSS